MEEQNLIVGAASSARALRALAMDGSNNQGIAAKPILEPPKGVPLMGTSQTSSYYRYAFNTSQETSSFRKVVEESGWSAAAHAKIGWSLGQKSASAKFSYEELSKTIDETKLEEKVEEAYVLQMFYVPMKSFQIPNDKMCLTQEAIAAARSVDSSTDAQRFLRTYHSHVSGSLYHVGGIFCRQVTVQSKERMSFKSLVATASSKMSGSSDVSLGWLEAGGEASKSESSEKQSDDSSKVTVKEEKASISAFGASTAMDEESFRARLETDQSSWVIIDKSIDRADDLVGVWEIMLQVKDKGLQQPARLIRESWQTTVSNFVRMDDLLARLLDRSKPADSEHIPLPPLPSPVEPAQLPSKLEALLLDVSDQSGSAGTDAFCRQVEQLIKSCITGFPSESGPLIRVILHYSFDDKGNLLTQMNSGGLRSLIQELKEVLQGSENPPSVPSAARCWEEKHMHILPDQYSSGSTFSYTGDIVVDRPFNDTEAPRDRLKQCQRFLDCLRHRSMELGLSLKMPADDVESDSDDWFGEDDNTSTDKSDSKGDSLANLFQSPLELLVHIMDSSDLPAQIAFCMMLLGQRSAAPLVLPNRLSVGTFTQYARALSFGKVKLAKQQVLSLMEDTHLPRVVFISNRNMEVSLNAMVASRVLHCEFVSQHHRGQGIGQWVAPLVEVGVGFVHDEACLAFHVLGHYEPLLQFVQSVATVIVLELEPSASSADQSFTRPCIHWEHSMNPGISKKDKKIQGPETFVVEKVAGVLGTMFKNEREGRTQQDGRKALQDTCIAHLPTKPLITFQELQDTVSVCDFTNLREGLLLQKSFAKEAELWFECQRLWSSPIEKRKKDIECLEERRKRLGMAGQVICLPILQFFHALLSQDDYESRRVGMMCLQSAIDDKIGPVLEEASRSMDQAFQDCQQDPNNQQLRDLYHSSKEAYVGKKIGLDHLWRELCHIFVSDPERQRQLARLAAQHLLDGFPLEIMDGDAGMFCREWVETVLVESNELLLRALGKTPRIFVLSAMGMQSSGKSTLLNLMFGTQLQTSAGQCTRGVYMQLVKSEREEYDYVLLLDTEGLKSPEFFGIAEANTRDNRLATLGVLAADACVFMVANEDDSGLKEVLPMVMLAFKGSIVAETSGGRIRAKLFFVYRSVNTNETGKLRENKRKLQEYLREAAIQVAKLGQSEGKASVDDGKGGQELLQAMFNDFHVDDEEEKSDVKCMGNLTKGHMPPEDTPNWSYGEQIVNLREYIHRRVTTQQGQWRATELRQWAEHLSRVWECISTADFELSFSSAVEYESYRILKGRLNDVRKELSKKYIEEFEGLELELGKMQDEGEDTREQLYKTLEAQVSSTKEQAQMEVETIWKEPRWQKWRAQEESSWVKFCEDLDAGYRIRLDDYIAGILRFENVVREYEMKVKQEIAALIDAGTLQMEGRSKEEYQEEKEKHFRDIFERIKHEAMESHPPYAGEVPRAVTTVYQDSEVANRFNIFADEDHRELQKEAMSKLEEVLKQLLRNVKQYSVHVVLNAIAHTEALEQTMLKERWQQAKAHRWMMSKLSSRLQDLQHKWDEAHNVVDKLIAARQQLWQYFEVRADLEGVAKLLMIELQSLLLEKLEEAFKQRLVNNSAGKLENAQWMYSWKGMRACLDLHLILLMESGQTSNLLESVRDGSLHYSRVIPALIEDTIDTLYATSASQFIHDVQNSLKEAGSYALDAISVDSFIDKLVKSLQQSSPMLAAKVHSIYRKPYEGYKLNPDFYSQQVPELCKSVHDTLKLKVEGGCKGADKEMLVQKVRERLEQCSNENAATRCDARCATCGISCFLQYGHTTKHDTVHQPAGLSGWMAARGELSSSSCSQSVERDLRFWHEGKTHRYKDFETVFPGWKLPSSMADGGVSIRVREYIFYHYQQQLVNKYEGGRNVCRHLPPEYQHDLALIRNDLRNQFGSTQMFDHMCKVLRSIQCRYWG